jgi:hypothetical protein
MPSEHDKSIDPDLAAAAQDSTWPPLPSGRLDCYWRLWQLELWLRELVYMELKCRYGNDWADHIYQKGRKGKGAQRADNRLTHMPTRETGPLSYITFDSLVRIISKHRRLFAPYLPVRSVWDARLEEVGQIRNRVAHFRRGHASDLQRVNQLVGDIDKGIWLFATSYNDPHPIYPPGRDRVAKTFIDLDPFPWSPTGNGAVVRIGSASPDMTLSVSVEILRRPWLKSRMPADLAGKYGYLYDVHLAARRSRAFDLSNFLRNTKALHDLCCHIHLDNSGALIRLTLPAVLGASPLIDAIEKFIEAARHALRPTQPFLEDGRIDALVEKWPEYVLGPNDPLSFLGPDMPCSMFEV